MLVALNDFNQNPYRLWEVLEHQVLDVFISVHWHCVATLVSAGGSVTDKPDLVQETQG